MVQFAATLEKQRNQDWKDFYIDYHVRFAVCVCFTFPSRAVVPVS